MWNRQRERKTLGRTDLIMESLEMKSSSWLDIAINRLAKPGAIYRRLARSSSGKEAVTTWPARWSQRGRRRRVGATSGRLSSTGSLQQLEERVTLTAVPSAWYDANGTFEDTVGINDGVMQGNVRFASGVTGQAFSFDGNDAINVPKQNGAFDPGAGDFTISTWVQIQPGALTDNTNYILLNYNLTSYYGLSAVRVAPDRYVASFDARDVDHDASGILSTVDLDDGVWHHIAASRQGSHFRLFIDGVLDQENIAPNVGALSNSNSYVRIGAANTGADLNINGPLSNEDFFIGLIDDLRFYREAVPIGELISNRPPVSDPGGPYEVCVCGTVTLDGSGSFDPDGVDVLYEWDLNFDGTVFDADVQGESVEFDASSLVFSEIRAVALRATDADGYMHVATTTIAIEGYVKPSIRYEGEGTFEDTVGINDGLMQGNVGFASGVTGQAFSFDGNDAINVPKQNGTFDPGAGDFTISTWVQIQPGTLTDNTNYILLNYNLTSYYGLSVVRVAPDRYVASFDARDVDHDASGILSTVDLDDGMWHHIAASRQGSHFRLFIDGVLDQENIAPNVGALSTSNSYVRIGAANTGADLNINGPLSNEDFFIGLIDDLRFYRQAVPVNGLLDELRPMSHWNFDEETGSDVFDSMGSNNGILGGGVARISESIAGASLQLDGVDGFVEITPNSSLNLVVAATIDAWIAPESFGQSSGAAPRVVSKGFDSSTDSNSPYEIVLVDDDGSSPEDGVVRLILSDGVTSQVITGNVVLQSNEYSHVAATWDGSIVRIYVNGVLDTEVQQTVIPYANQQPLQIGRAKDASLSGGTSFYSGLLDEVGVFPYALSSTQILCRFEDVKNDPPRFTPGGDVTVLEDSGAYEAIWATGISAGSSNETTLGLTFQVTNDSAQLFSVQPTIDAAGVLRFTPALNTAGTAAVTVTLRDSEGGNDTSAPVVFSLTIDGRLSALTDADTAANSVMETATVGTTVGITALSVDSDLYDSVTYSLDDNAGGRFAIGPATGIVTVAGSLDYESATFHDIVVRATSTDGSFVTQSWRIDVQDVQEAFLIAGTHNSETIRITPTSVAGQYSYRIGAGPSVVFTPTGDVLISGNGGIDQLIMDGTNAVNSFDIHHDTIVFNGTNFQSVSVTSRTINALGSGDTIQIFGGSAIVNGGAALDTLVAMSATNHVWTLTGANSGNLDGLIQFTGVERLVGGALDDLFQIGASGSVSSLVDGGGGHDVLDYSQVTTPNTVNLQTGTATKAGVATNIEQFTGSTATDTLIGRNAATLWTLTGVNSGSYDGITGFAGFENLTGGTAADTFEMQSTASLSGNLNGGSGVDSLAFFTNDNLSANLETRQISHVGGVFTSVENVDFGSGTNAVIGTNTTTTWRPLAANQVLVDGIDFAPVQQIVGGSAVDTVLGPNVVNTWNLTGVNAGSAFSLAWNGIEQITGGTQVDTFFLQPGASLSGTLNGGGGSDVVSFQNYDTSVVVNLGTNTMTGVATIASLSTFLGTTFNDTFIGANNTNSWTFTTNGGSVDGIGFVGFENWQGGTATDTLRGANVAAVWNIDGQNAGELNGYRFVSMENLTGGSDVDQFRLLPSGQVTGIVQGGGANDVLDWSAYDSPVGVNLGTSSATNVASFASIMELVGGSQPDTLTGADNANTWLLSTALGGTVDGVAFRQFESLVGGAAVDTFRPSASAIFTGHLNGGAGSDKLDYATFTTPVSVDLARGLASQLTSVSGVECITGGTSDDLLIGDAQDNTFLGRNGNDILIGGGGNDTLSGDNGRDIVIGGTGLDVLHGNAADDILVGGWTLYAAEDASPANEAALSDLRSEWVRTDLAYAARISHLLGTTAGGLNGSHLLNSATLSDDAVADTLFGDTNQDWFLSGLDDVLDLALNEIDTDV